MEIHEFTINRSSTEQRFSLYVIICTKDSEHKIYVGQTGNQNKGCANITYRLGKHMAYSGTDNILRKKLGKPEEWELEVIFVHVYDYDGTNTLVGKMKELESYLISELKKKFQGMVLNDNTTAFNIERFNDNENRILSSMLERVTHNTALQPADVGADMPPRLSSALRQAALGD